MSTAPAFTTLERAALDGFLAGIALGQAPAEDPVAEVLGQDPSALSTRQMALAHLATSLLPVGALSPVQKAVYGRQDHAMLPTLVMNLTEAQRLLDTLGVRFDVPPERLQQLLEQKGAFETFKLLGMQLTNNAMDMRALTGAFLAFLIDSTVAAVDRRYHDPKVDRLEREHLLSEFAPALLAIDEILRYPAERKGSLADRRAGLSDQAAEAQADAQLAETTLKLHQDLFVPRQERFAAARRHLERTQPQSTPPAPAPAGLPPPTGSRRIPII